MIKAHLSTRRGIRIYIRCTYSGHRWQDAIDASRTFIKKLKAEKPKAHAISTISNRQVLITSRTIKET